MPFDPSQVSNSGPASPDTSCAGIARIAWKSAVLRSKLTEIILTLAATTQKYRNSSLIWRGLARGGACIGYCDFAPVGVRSTE
jgi:hypothetical protein